MSAEGRSRFPLRWSLALSAFFILVSLAGSVSFLGFQGFTGLDNSWSDALFRWHMAELPSGDPRIVVASMDDETLHKYGFPPPRSMHAEVIDALTKLGARTVAFDVLFLEKSPYDAQLIAATRRNGRVVHLYEGHLDDQGKPVVQPPAPGLAAAAQYLGYPDISGVIDSDGHVRRASFFEPGLTDPKTGAGPGLSLDAAALASFTGRPPADVVNRFGSRDADGHWASNVLYLNFRQPIDWTKHDQDNGLEPPASGVGVDSPYLHVAIRDLLGGKLPAADKKALRGALVLVGSTATGYFDHYPNPFISQAPGVEYHANILDNALHGDWLRPQPEWVEILVLLAFIWLPMLLGTALPPAGAAAAFAALLLGWLVACSMLFTRGWRVDFPVAALALIASFLGQTVDRVLAEGKEKRFIKNLFGQFVAPEVVDDLAKDPAKVKLGGEKKDMTIFFLDIAHFTTISEKMQPEALIVFLNKYLSALTQVVHEEKGVVDKYIGDCIMAFWNAPMPMPDHRLRGCLAAIACQKTLDKLNEKLEPGMPEIPAIRIGLNSGHVTVGLTGSEKKLQYTVIGDEVNLASRLEGANKFFGSRIMASEATYEGAKEHVEARELGRVRVVGKETPIRVYELLDKKGELSADWQRALPLYRKGLELFNARKYAEAVAPFQEFVAVFPKDGPGNLYLNASRDYAAIPPDELWEGVFNLTAK